MTEKKSAEEVLQELGKKIDVLIAEVKRAGKGISEDMEAHIRDLKERKEKIESELNKGSGKSKAKWEEFRNHLNEAAESIHKAFASIFK